MQGLRRPTWGNHSASRGRSAEVASRSLPTASLHRRFRLLLPCVRAQRSAAATGCVPPISLAGPRRQARLRSSGPVHGGKEPSDERPTSTPGASGHSPAEGLPPSGEAARK